MIQEYTEHLLLVIKIKLVINKAVFTSCEKDDNCPAWSIKAKKITHDKNKKDIIYDKAVLKVYDFQYFIFQNSFILIRL